MKDQEDTYLIAFLMIILTMGILFAISRQRESALETRIEVLEHIHQP